MLLRFAARKKQRQPLKADDWFLVPATLLTIGIGVSMVYGVSKKALAYPFEVPPDPPEDSLSIVTEQIGTEGAIQWAYTLLLPLALGCTKASFLLFYRRIFAVSTWSKTNMLLVGMCVFVFVWMAAYFFTFLFMCRLDFWALWTTARAILDHCIADTYPNFTLAVTDVAADVVILVIPIPLVWRLNLTTAKKIAITSVFLFGAITVAASVTRLALTTRILAVGYDPDDDPILLVTSFIYWGMVESGIAVFVACLPTLWIFSKGSSWVPLIRVARNLANSSISSLRLLRTRRSKQSIDVEDPCDTRSLRSHANSRPTDAAQIT